MDWDAMRVFLALARSGRASGAARKLGVEHTTVARRLAALEAELGVALFYRTAAGYRLTPHGERVLPSAEAMEHAALGVGALAREGTEALAGRVRIALLDEFASHWLAPALPAFRARHPGIELELSIGIHQLDLTRGEAELAIRTPRPRQPELTSLRLGAAPLALYASRSLIGARRFRVTDLATLRGLPLLVYSALPQPLQNAPWFRPILARAPLALRTNSTHALLAAARAGAGVAVVPHFVARSYPELACVSADLSALPMWLVTHAQYRRDPNVHATAAFLRELAADL